jgi:hypothetical protein
MKGVEETLQNFVFIVATIVAIFLLVAIVSNLLQPTIPEELEVKGSEEQVMQELRNLIYECWDKYRGSLEAHICFKIFFNFDGNITEDKLIEKIDVSRIEKENVEVENIDGPCNLLIKYGVNKVILETR